MPKGMLYDASKKKWRTVEDIKKNDIDKPLDELANISDSKDVKRPSTKTIENARSILGNLVDAISDENEKRRKRR